MGAWEWARRLHLPTLTMFAVVVVAWTLLSRRYGAYVLPAPWSIVTGFVEIVADVTKLPPDVIKVAYRETVKMLYGLPEEQVDTLIVQLKINKEYGFLKSDIWDNPDRIRKEFFHRA